MLDAFSPAQVLLDACRTKSDKPGSRVEEATTDGNLRACGIHRQATVSNQLCEAAASVVGKQVLASWQESIGPTNSPSDLEQIVEADAINTDAAAMVTRLHLMPAGVAANGSVTCRITTGQ